MTKEEFAEEAMGIMFADSSTTSTTLTYLLYAISRPKHRHIQQRLREEMRNTPDEIISLRNLPYLNAVFKEMFRLYLTIISTLPRIFHEPLIIEVVRACPMNHCWNAELCASEEFGSFLRTFALLAWPMADKYPGDGGGIDAI